jgi:hypothetical protein
MYIDGTGNKVLRRIFGLKRNEVIGGWRKLNHVELHNMYLNNQVKEDGWGRKRSMHAGENKCKQGSRWKTRIKTTTRKI